MANPSSQTISIKQDEDQHTVVTSSAVRNSSILIVLFAVAYRLLAFVLNIEVAHERQIATLILAGVVPLSLIYLGKQVQASRIGLMIGWVALVDISFINSRGSLMAISGYIIIMLVALISIPDRTWLFLLWASIAAVTLNSTLVYINATTSIQREDMLRLGIQEVLTISLGSAFVALLYRRTVRMLAKQAQDNRELNRQRAALSEMQSTLEQNTRIMRHVIDNIPAHLFYTDPEGVVVFTNHNTVLNGVEVSPVGKLPEEFIPLAHLEKLEPHFARALDGRASEIDIVTSHEAEGGRVERYNFYPHSIGDEVEGVFIFSADITETWKVDQAMAQTQKLESLGLLAGGIAHDFNNLLAAILGQSSLAVAKMDGEHPARRHINRSVDAARRAAKLTQQMLAYSGNGSFSIELLDVNRLISENLELFSVSVPSTVELRADLHPDLPSVKADPSQIQQLIMNLIINAGQAFGDGSGWVEVRTAVEEISAETDSYWEITGEPMMAGTYIRVQVADNGKGMTPSTKAQIFDPFFTTKTNGTGLGLAAALGIIRGHSGGIRLESIVGVGTTFDLLFPARDSLFYDESDALDMLATSHTNPGN